MACEDSWVGEGKTLKCNLDRRPQGLGQVSVSGNDSSTLFCLIFSYYLSLPHLALEGHFSQLSLGGGGRQGRAFGVIVWERILDSRRPLFSLLIPSSVTQRGQPAARLRLA